jgi:hypothetical protein
MLNASNPEMIKCRMEKDWESGIVNVNVNCWFLAHFICVESINPHVLGNVPLIWYFPQVMNTRYSNGKYLTHPRDVDIYNFFDQKLLHFAGIMQWISKEMILQTNQVFFTTSLFHRSSPLFKLLTFWLELLFGGICILPSLRHLHF